MKQNSRKKAQKTRREIAAKERKKRRTKISRNRKGKTIYELNPGLKPRAESLNAFGINFETPFWNPASAHLRGKASIRPDRTGETGASLKKRPAIEGDCRTLKHQT